MLHSLRLPGQGGWGRLHSPRGPTGKPLTGRYSQLHPAPGLWFPPRFLRPHHPQHRSTEIVPGLKLESTNRSWWGCGTRAGGKDRRRVQDWGDRDGTSPEGSHRKAGDRQKWLGGKSRVRTARKAGIWDREPSEQLDEALQTRTGQG